MKEDILRQLNDFMVLKNISRSELARRLNISRSYVTQFFNQNTNFTIDSLENITNVLGISMSFNIKEVE